MLRARLVQRRPGPTGLSRPLQWSRRKWLEQAESGTFEVAIVTASFSGPAEVWGGSSGEKEAGASRPFASRTTEITTNAPRLDCCATCLAGHEQHFVTVCHKASASAISKARPPREDSDDSAGQSSVRSGTRKAFRSRPRNGFQGLRDFGRGGRAGEVTLDSPSRRSLSRPHQQRARGSRSGRSQTLPSPHATGRGGCVISVDRLSGGSFSRRCCRRGSGRKRGSR